MDEYAKWRKTIDETFPWIADTLEACLSVSVLLWFEDVQLPFALVLVGVPAGWKTMPLKCIDESMLPYVYYSDSFTPKSFVTHTVEKSKKELGKIDLLPKIKDKIFVTPELAPTFSQEKDKLTLTVGIFTRILDGQGYISDSGSQGRRGYQGKFKFMWLAATTPMPYRVWNIMATLGTKMYFYHVKEPKWSKKEKIEWVQKNKYAEYFPKAQKATSEFLDFLKSQTPVKWNVDKDPPEVVEFIYNLANMLARLRGKVNVAFRHDRLTGQKIPVYTTPIIEDSTRAFIMLLTLARGHAFMRGRREISADDMGLVIDVATSSAPKDRVEAFRLLLRSGGKMRTSDIVKATGCSDHTAARAMEILDILKLANYDKKLGREGSKVTIVDDMRWCVESSYMLAWGAKKAHKPMKRHESVEGERFEILDGY